MKPSLPDYVATFLKKFSLKEYEIEWQKKSEINNVMVIPVIAEFENIKILLCSLLKNDPGYFNSTLVLFVINNSPISSAEVKDDNQKSLDYLRSVIFNNLDEEYVNEVKQSGISVGFIDVASEGKELDEKQSGVGLARKIGMDLALTIFDYTQKSKKLIICLDADCTVKQNYLTTIVSEFNKYNFSAAVINYAHDIDGDEDECRAIIPYEIFLRYYAEGLKYAGSEYAFPTIGSTTVCDVDAYIKSGGMNKRKAAEDFYFLEKIAKNYSIGKINSTTVFPSNRSSWRVPFGTGQRVARFFKKTHDEYQLFDPVIFKILKDWLQLFNSNAVSDPEYILSCSRDIHIELYNFLINQKYPEHWENIIRDAKSDKQLSHQKKIWFDAFSTLKLIHHLRDTAYPNINMFDALDMFFINLGISNPIKRIGNDIPELEVQKQYLRLLREIWINH
jgi:hypothetical protein